MPDGPAGETPAGDWYELVGSAYDRTLYGFQIETSAAQGDKFIAVYNARPNRESYKLVSRNCADLKDGLHGETSRHHWVTNRQSGWGECGPSARGSLLAIASG